jgi:hypothetical protein
MLATDATLVGGHSCIQDILDEVKLSNSFWSTQNQLLSSRQAETKEASSWHGQTYVPPCGRVQRHTS